MRLDDLGTITGEEDDIAQPAARERLDNPLEVRSPADLDHRLRQPRRERAGAEVIYQAALADGDWRGYADFLERVPRPSPALGDWSYEVIDTKLARRPKPEFIVQLCLYSDLLARLQGLQPEHMHVVLGTGERETFRLQEFAAFYRRLLGRYDGRLAQQFAGTYPEPVAHCDLCRYAEHCKARWLADDYPTLIAGVGRTRASNSTRCP